MEGGKCLWQRILIHKYKLERDGWFVPGRDYKASGIWRSIPSVKGVFDQWVRYKAHDGQRIKFWLDIKF